MGCNARKTNKQTNKQTNKHLLVDVLIVKLISLSGSKDGDERNKADS
jgi:hypothetical protein